MYWLMIIVICDVMSGCSCHPCLTFSPLHTHTHKTHTQLKKFRLDIVANIVKLCVSAQLRNVVCDLLKH